MTNPTPQPTPHYATLSGRWLVVLTLSLFLLVPTITYFSYKATQGTPPRADLDYDNRDRWFMMDVKPRPLRYSKFVAAETGKQYKKTDLHIDPDVEAVLQHCATLAQDPIYFAANTKVRDTLEQYANDDVNGFYPPYLLASWHLANDNREEHDRWMRIACDRADTALAQRIVDDKAQPVEGYRLPPVAIGYDRVTNGKLDATLVLIYPIPISDANGFVYLPTYRSIYRLTDPALPLGIDPGLHPTKLTFLPQESNGTAPNWFAVPDGAVGRLPDATMDFEAIVEKIQKAFDMNSEDDQLPPAEPAP